MFSRRKKRVRQWRGATLVEYALLLSLLACIAVGSVKTVGSNVGGLMNDIAAALVADDYAGSPDGGAGTDDGGGDDGGGDDSGGDDSGGDDSGGGRHRWPWWWPWWWR